MPPNRLKNTSNHFRKQRSVKNAVFKLDFIEIDNRGKGTKCASRNGKKNKVFADSRLRTLHPYNYPRY